MGRSRLFLGLFASLSLVGAAVAGDTFTLEILHTNDTHGYTRPDAQGAGGVGALARKIEAARARSAKDPSYDVLVIDAGDLFGGAPEDSFSRGAMMTDMVAALKYDAYCIGNHDFGYGLPTLKQTVAKLREAGVKVLVSNMLDSTGQVSKDLAEPGIIFERKGLKIGVVGAITPGTGRMNLDENVEGLRFEDPAGPVGRAAQELLKKGAHVVIMVSHVGLDGGKYVDDKKVCAKVPEVRVVIGGHSHTEMRQAFVEPTHKALIVQAGAQTRNIGSLKLTFDAKTHAPVDANKDGAIDHEYVLIPLASESGEHSLAADLKARYWDPIQAQLDAAVGVLSVSLYRKFYKTETQLGNFIADAVRLAAPSATLGLVSNSDMRADMRDGDVRVKDVFRALPFDNEVVLATVSGELLKKVMEASYGDGRSFAQISGMSVEVDSARPAGQRVIKMFVGDAALNPGGQYKLATTDYICQGKGGFSAFQGVTYAKTGTLVRDAVSAHFKRLGTVTADSIPMRRQRDAQLMAKIGQVTGVFSTDQATHPNLFELMTAAIRGVPARGDLALVDVGSLHWKLQEKYPVTKKDIFEMASFDNGIVTCQVKGSQLNQIAKDMAKAYQGGQRRGPKPWFSGASLLVSATGGELLIDGKPVDAARTYTLVTVDHLFKGVEGYGSLAGLTPKPTGAFVRAALEAFFKSQSPVGPEDFGEKPGVVLGNSRSVDRVRNFDRIKAKDDVEQPAEVEAPKHDCRHDESAPDVH